MNVQENISLKKYNTFGIDARARYFAAFTTAAELEALPEFKRISLLPLGGGSNLLLTKDFDGLVLKNEIGGIKKIAEDAEHVYIKAGAGVNWHVFVLHCIENNWAGVENLSLIPGNVGASPMQNIGAYGVEIKDVFHELEAFHLADKERVQFDSDECKFGYRESVFKQHYKGEFMITQVTYRLNKKPVFNMSYGTVEQELERMGIKELSIQAISKAIINIRRSKLPDPAIIGNAGSFFKNPQVSDAQAQLLKAEFPDIVGHKLPDGGVKLAAGWLIEQCGWKGYRKGDAGCYDKQALVLVNFGDAKGEELYALSEAIIQSVQKKFNIELEREVNIV